MGAGLGAEQRVVHPHSRIVNILRCRDHIEVAGNDHLLFVGQQRFDALF